VGRRLTLDDIGMGKAAATQESTPLDVFLGKATALWRGDQQQREELQRAPVITGLPAVGPVWEWENPPDDRDVSSRGTVRVGLPDVETLRTARSHYEQMYRKAGGVTTRARVRQFLVK